MFDNLKWYYDQKITFFLQILKECLFHTILAKS